jgi:hypothetical protein
LEDRSAEKAGESVNANAFRNFADREYKIDHWAGIQKDAARTNPQIPAATIYRSVVYGTVVGCRSVLQLDQKGRFASFKELVGSDRDMVASDTTVLRALAEWDLERARMANYATRVRLLQEGLGHVRLSTGRKVDLAVVDGTNVGGHWMSVLGFAGAVTFQPVDLEPSEGRGHELVTSRALLMRAQEKLGRGFATHVGYDGLMADRIDLAFVCKGLGAHLVVKTREEDSLEIIQSTKGIWSKLSDKELVRDCGVEIIEGCDEQRGVAYKVYAQGGIKWKGLGLPLKLAWVKLRYLKGPRKGQTETFWVITTDQSLTAAELREMAHLRWRIENNAFKELSEQLGTKRAYIKNATAKQAVMLMGFLGMTLLQAFEWFLETFEQWHCWGVRKTKRVMGYVVEYGIPGEGLGAQAPP